MSQDDPIVRETRRFREEHAAQFNYNFQTIVEDLRRSEAARDASRSPLNEQPEVLVAPLDTAVQRARFVRR